MSLSALVACAAPDEDPLAPPPGSLLDDPYAELPTSLRATGMYPRAPELQSQPSIALPYDPAWPLWSSGSDKQRYLVLPPGETIDNSVSDAWRVPVGTLLFKTFSYPDAQGRDRPVETRVMRLDAQGEWDFAAYQWDEAGEDATLLDIDRPTKVAVPGQPELMHTIPARLECRQCHEASPDPVLGLSEVQLAGQLGALADAGALQQEPPSSPAAITHPDAATQQVLGWFHGNCVHCHNGTDAENASFSLLAADALANTIDQPTQSSASAEGIRIVPGLPEQSVLWLVVSGEGDDPELEDMPPVGIDRRDDAGVEMLRDFIEELSDE